MIGLLIRPGTQKKFLIIQKKKCAIIFMLIEGKIDEIQHYAIGVKVQNMKMDINTEGTWHRVGQWTLMMKIYDFFLFS